MITFNNIVERFRVFADAHFFVKSFSFGSPDDVDLSKFTNFPLMHLVYTGATYDAGTKTYNLEVYILDVPADKEQKTDRQKEVVSDAEQCAEDIIADIKNGGNIFLFAQDYEVVNATTTPLEEETKNVLSGVLLDLSVAIPYEWDACNAPIDGVSPEGGDEVAYARRGILRMLTENGVTDVLSVRTIKVTNGTLTDEGDGVVTLDTGGATELNDLDDVGITDPVQNQTLLYNMIGVRGWYNATLYLSTLADTKGTPVEGKYLKYTGGFWQPADVAATLGQLTDVDTSSQSPGYVLMYTGSTWSAAALPIINGTNITRTFVGGFAQLNLNPNITLTAITADTLKATGDLVLQVDSDNNGASNNLIVKDGANNEVFRISEAGVVTINQEYSLPTADGTANQLLKTDGAKTLSFGANLQDLDNVATLTPGPGQVLTWVGSEWQPSSPTSPPPDTNLANTNLTQTGNRTFDHGGLTLTFDLNDGGEFIVTDTSDPAFGESLKCGSGTLKIHNIFYPDSDGTAGQVMTTDGAGTLSFTSLTQYHDRYQSDAATLRSGATATTEIYYSAIADGDGYAESASSDTPATGYDIRRKLYYSEAGFADPDTGTWVQFATIPDDTTFASAKATLLAYLKERTGGTVPISLKMTWEEVAEAPAFTGLLNESYGSGAAAAYSVRRLNGNYTGAAIQVERSSDNTTQDIGFDSNGDLDESALTTFCTGTVCKVRTWYDQSVTGGTGSGNDAVQTDHTKQPTIYTGGAIVKRDGKAALLGDSNDNLQFTSIAHTSDFLNIVLYEVFLSDKVVGGASASNTFIGSAVSSYGILRNRFAGTNIQGSVQLSANEKILLTTNRASNSVNLKVDGTSIATVTNSSSIAFEYLLSGDGGADPLNGAAQEVIFYTSDKSTDRTQIESNIGDYFTQNTPLLDTYTGAAAAYSLRKLRSAYSGSAIRVRRASDNTEQDIGFNVFGELDTVSLASFCSGTNGFVKTWYDQSGNANDATQSTTANQPKIYDSSTGVVTENGKPAVEFDGASTYLRDSNLTTSGAHTVLSVNKYTAEANENALYDSDTSPQTIGYIDTFGDWLVQYGGTWTTSVAASTSQDLTTFVINGSSSVLFIDGTSVSTGNPGANNMSGLTIGATRTAGVPWNGNIQEFLIYDSDQSTNRTGIESNINTFYSIY